jgi:hypothetical protein
MKCEPLSTFIKMMMIVLGGILFHSTSTAIPSVSAATDNEAWVWIMECIPKPSLSCDRVTLYLMGECEKGEEISSLRPAFCEDSIKKYVIENGLQNERRLTQDEVVEDFRILDQQPPG